MKTYLTKNDVLEILARHFDLPTEDVSTPPEKQTVLAWDELYWEGNAEIKEGKIVGDYNKGVESGKRMCRDLEKGTMGRDGFLMIVKKKLSDFQQGEVDECATWFGRK